MPFEMVIQPTAPLEGGLIALGSPFQALIFHLAAGWPVPLPHSELPVWRNVFVRTGLRRPVPLICCDYSRQWSVQAHVAAAFGKTL